MHFVDIKAIIKHIKKNISCPDCHRKFPDAGIHLLAIVNEELKFHLKCPFCQTMLEAEISIIDNNRKTQKLNTNDTKVESIKTEDVKEIHKFLEQFDGDFETLFFKQQ